MLPEANSSKSLGLWGLLSAIVIPMVRAAGLLANILSSYLFYTYLLWTGKLKDKLYLQESAAWNSYIFRV